MTSLRRNEAFTMMEIVMAIVLMAVLGTVGVVLLGDSADASKYEQTRQQLEKLREGVVGDTSLNAKSGRRTNFGFIGDWGGLPSALTNLTSDPGSAYSFNSTYGFGAGWRGPYVSAAIDGVDELKDAWGTSFVLSTAADPATVTSYGSDAASGTTAGDLYSADIVVEIPDRQWKGTIRGRVLNGSTAVSGSTVRLRYPSAGSITSGDQTSAGDGSFSFTNVPFGIRSIEVTTPNALTQRQIIVDNANYEIPAEVLNFQTPEKSLDSMCCRLSLSSTEAVPSSDLTAQGTVYLLAFNGNQIPLYNTGESTWKVHYLSSSISVAAPSSADTNFDVFVYDSSGTLTLEAVTWTNDSTRATALTTQDGILVKSGTISRRYLGTARTVASAQVDDRQAKRFLWNHYNRVARSLKATYATASWVTDGGVPCDNVYCAPDDGAQTTFGETRVGVVVGQADAAVQLAVTVRGYDSGSNAHYVGIGDNKTNGSDGDINGENNGTTTRSLKGTYRGYPTAGYHYFQWVENGNNGTTSWESDGSGLIGTVEG